MTGEPMTGEPMTGEPMTGEPMTREERLAAKLRENLRRRKVQARAQGGNDGHEQSQDDPLPNLTPKS